MSASLLTTLFAASAKTTNFVNNGGADPDPTNPNVASAAQLKDSLDTAFDRWLQADDNLNSLNAFATGGVRWTLDTLALTGKAIAFLRFKWRARTQNLGPGPFGNYISANVTGTSTGTQLTIESSSFAAYSEDLATDPTSGLPWTVATVNAAKHGWYLNIDSQDPSFGSTARSDVSEFSVEVWGNDASTPTSVTVASSSGAPTSLAGVIVSSPDAASVASASTTPTAALGVVTSSPASVEVVSSTAIGTDISVEVARSPAATTPQAAQIDLSGGPLTIRSNTAPFKDQSLSTHTLQSGVGPSSGTKTFNFGGIATTQVDGTGTIAGIKCFAIVRCGKDSGTLNNVKIYGTAASPQPTINALPLTSLMWETISTPLIPLTIPGGIPFTWGLNLAGELASWGLTADWNVTNPGDLASIDVAEAWIEVHGAIGSAPSIIAVSQRMQPIRIVAVMGSSINP